MSCKQKRQLVRFPKVRILKQWFRHFNDHKEFHIVSNILQRAGIQKDDRIWGMCMLRHNAASTMVQNSIPLATIAAILGHAGTRTTDIYGNTAGPFRERRGPAVWLFAL